MPAGFIEHVEKSSRGFLWAGKDIEKRGKCLVKWDKVCRPKKAGGLGVLDLKTQNSALILKFLHKFMNKMDLPWVQLIWQAHYHGNRLPQAHGPVGSFWWKDCLSLMDKFLSHFHVESGTGDTIRLWRDLWDDTTLVSQYPHLCSCAKQEDISLQAATESVLNRDVYDLFHTPLSAIATQQYNQLVQKLTTRGSTIGTDVWSISGANGTFRSNKLYKLLRPYPTAPEPFQWIWRSCVLPKQKFFFWLLIQDRLNTRDLLTRKQFQIPSKHCVLCDHTHTQRIFIIYSLGVSSAKNSGIYWDFNGNR